jgi:NAD/NADP transhydrogenase beta subunit
VPDRFHPEILPPQRPWRAWAERVFSDENLDRFAHLLDDCFGIPGTRIRFGLDGLIGLIPGLGDVLGGIASCVLILAAWVRGVPYVTLIRMLVNLAIDVLIGAIPFLGDVFDIAWKANRRNYRLMVRHLREPRRHTWKDYAFLMGLGAVIFVILTVPVAVVLLLILWLLHR